MGLQLFNPDGRLRGSFVYLVLCGEAEKIYIKVGRSSNPFQRLNDLRVGCPFVPSIMATTEVAGTHLAKQLESDMHQALKAWHSHGEWFVLTRQEKAEFNAITAAVLKRHGSPSRRLTWRQYSVPDLIKDGDDRRRYVQAQFARLGSAFRDFKKAGGR